MDVAIIGAGISGLAAADELIMAGIKPTVFEARDRVGGRILTVREKQIGAPIELGAEFVHGRPAETLDISRAAGLEMVETGGEFWKLTKDGTLSPIGDEPPGSETTIWDRVESYLRENDDISLEDFLALPGIMEIDRRERERTAQFVAGFHAAELDKVGVGSLIKTQQAEEQIGGMTSFRIPAGYDSLPEFLHLKSQAAGSKYLLNHCVTRIRWQRGAAEVEASSNMGLKSYHFDAAIITLPAGVLKGSAGTVGHVIFEPILPEKTSALEKIHMGAARRIVFAFRESWWSDRLEGIDPRRSTLGFLFAAHLPIPVWWTSEPLRSPLLTGWIGGRKAIELAGTPDELVIELAIDSLGHIFGPGRGEIASQLISASTYDWSADTYSLGAYSYLGVEGVAASRELSRTIEEALYFAGEATSFDGHWGTVHGAVSTGRRAAREIIKARA